MTTPAIQLTITIPEGALPGSVLEIPIRGGKETVKATVPEGMGAGSTLVLTKLEGREQWCVGDEYLALADATQAASKPQPDSPAAAPPPIEEQQKSPGPPPVQSAPPSSQDVVPQSSPVAPPVTGSGPVAYTVRLDTTVGVIDIIVRPDWAPHGARRFLDLAACGDLDELAFYRSVKGCLAQFGLPAKRQWPALPDDPPTGVPFLLGAVCFAAVGANSRKSTLFICIGDMSHNFGQQSWETPIGAVAEHSLDVLDRIETVYGDIAECQGAGPDTGRIHAEGNAYLRQDFPLLTYIKSAAPLDWQPPGMEVIPSAPEVAAPPARPAQDAAPAPAPAAQAPNGMDAPQKQLWQAEASFSGSPPVAAAVEAYATSQCGLFQGPAGGSAPSMPPMAKPASPRMVNPGAYAATSPFLAEVPNGLGPSRQQSMPDAGAQGQSWTAIDQTPNRAPLDVPVELSPGRRRRVIDVPVDVIDVPVEVVSSASRRQPQAAYRGGVVEAPWRLQSPLTNPSRVPAVGSGARATSPMPSGAARNGRMPPTHSVVYDNSAMRVQTDYGRPPYGGPTYDATSRHGFGPGPSANGMPNFAQLQQFSYGGGPPQSGIAAGAYGPPGAQNPANQAYHQAPVPSYSPMPRATSPQPQQQSSYIPAVPPPSGMLPGPPGRLPPGVPQYQPAASMSPMGNYFEDSRPSPFGQPPASLMPQSPMGSFFDGAKQAAPAGGPGSLVFPNAGAPWDQSQAGHGAAGAAGMPGSLGMPPQGLAQPMHGQYQPPPGHNPPGYGGRPGGWPMY